MNLGLNRTGEKERETEMRKEALDKLLKYGDLNCVLSVDSLISLSVECTYVRRCF